MGKTIKQISNELNVSKQAVWQRLKRSKELSALLENHAETINGTVYVDETLETLIKELRWGSDVDETINRQPVNVDETLVNIDGTGDNSTVNNDNANINVDETKDKHTSGVDGETINVDETAVNTNNKALIETLLKTIDTLQQQLSVKDNQIQDLTKALISSQEQQAALVTALTAAQALHAGTIKERLTASDHEDNDIPRGQNDNVDLSPQTESSDDISEQGTTEKKKSLWDRLFGKKK